MKATVQKIRLNGLDFILIDPESDNSAITTIRDYSTGRCGYAHLYRDTNIISRHGNQIGTLEDIEFGEIVEIEFDAGEAMVGLFGDSWF